MELYQFSNQHKYGRLQYFKYSYRHNVALKRINNYNRYFVSQFIHPMGAIFVIHHSETHSSKLGEKCMKNDPYPSFCNYQFVNFAHFFPLTLTFFFLVPYFEELCWLLLRLNDIIPLIARLPRVIAHSALFYNSNNTVTW